MQKKELLEIISNTENSEIEFKSDDLRPEQLAKEIVAFANSYGGKILIGVEDNGEITGIKRKNLEEWIMDTVCGKYIYPTIIPKYEVIKIDNNTKVAVLSVYSGATKPFVVKTKEREDIYIRMGSVSKLATREQIKRLSEISGLIHVETLPVPKAVYDVLDKVRVENYFKDIINDPQVPKTEAEWKQHLKDTGFLTDTDFQKDICTIAGLLLFGKSPRKYLKQAGIRLMAFNSKDKEYKALIDTVIDAPLVGRWGLDKNRKLELIDAGLIEKLIIAINPYITEETNYIEASLRREKKQLYPLEAIRELVLNSLAHRDWTRNVDIEISIYQDRIEITSPGSLPNSMTIEKMIGGRRTPRNPIIMEVLRDYQYVDARGMGIRVKVIPIMKKFNNTSPLFEETDDYLKTTLFKSSDLNLDPNDPVIDPNDPINPILNPNLDPNNPVIDPNDPNDPDTKIIALIAQNKNITYQELAEKIGYSSSTIKRKIAGLKKEKRIIRIGSTRKGYWEVSNPK